MSSTSSRPEPSALEEIRRVVEDGRPVTDPAHAPGKRRLGRAPAVDAPRRARFRRRRHQPWIPTSGLVGRKRRSARRG